MASKIEEKKKYEKTINRRRIWPQDSKILVGDKQEFISETRRFIRSFSGFSYQKDETKKEIVK